MKAQYLTIEAKQRQFFGVPASLNDFATHPGDSVDPNIILSSPNISLYCFDVETQRAIFTELPLTADLSTAPFVYQMQYDLAQRLIAMPYETFRQLAHQLPQVQHLNLIFSSGRSGSTLLSHVFNSLDTVLSLAEADSTSQFVHMRPTDGSGDADLRDLLDCTVRILFKPTPFKSPTIYVLKFRNEATGIMDLFQATFPHAKNLFQYRDAIGFVRSAYRLARAAGFPEFTTASAYTEPFVYTKTQPSDLLDPGVEQLSIPQQAALWWIGFIELYLEQVAKGIPILAVRYADLNASREQVVSAIFDYCGLPKERAKETLGVFERDAQAGTALAREKPSEGNQLQLTNEQIDSITRILARHPVIKSSDFIVPGTLQV